MILLEKKWQLPQYDEEIQGSPLLDRVLKARGITTPQEKEAFLQSGEGEWHDPFLMNDMSVAVDRILAAVRNGEKILICGDYDADGVTATAIMMLFLKHLGGNADYLLPSRLVEGYGVSAALIEKIRAKKPDLVVTVDCGVANADEIGSLIDENIDVIVTDHHEVKDVLPPALAVLDCKRKDNTYPYEHLCGAGVALKLAQACCLRINGQESKENTSSLEGQKSTAASAEGLSVAADEWENFIDIACIGTIADVVPLMGENRTIVKQGLRMLAQNRRLGLFSLLSLVRSNTGDMTVRMSARDIAFQVVPKINACGRLGDATRALELLLTSDVKRANELAQTLVEESSRRQMLEQQVMDEAIAQIESDPKRIEEMRNPSMPILVAGENWHVGILGIVASRLVDRFQRSAIVFSLDPESGMYKGSCRTAGEFPILECLKYCGDTVAQYGGHKRAAGVSIEAAKYSAFVEEVRKYAKERNSEKDEQVIEVDQSIEPEDMTLEEVQELSALEPFGEGNQEPLFLVSHLKIAQAKAVGEKQNHLKMSLSYTSNGQTRMLDSIAFRCADLWSDLYVQGSSVSVLGKPSTNTWNGETRVQMVVEDIHFTPIGKTIWDAPQVLENLFRNGLPLKSIAKIGNCKEEDLRPTGEEMTILYRFLQENCKGSNMCDLTLLARMVTGKYRKPLHAFKISRILDIFREAGLLEMVRLSDERICFSLLSVKDKVKLEDTKTFRVLYRTAETAGGPG